jgi:hypothetical protein
MTLSDDWGWRGVRVVRDAARAYATALTAMLGRDESAGPRG